MESLSYGSIQDSYDSEHHYSSDDDSFHREEVESMLYSQIYHEHDEQSMDQGDSQCSLVEANPQHNSVDSMVALVNHSGKTYLDNIENRDEKTGDDHNRKHFLTSTPYDRGVKRSAKRHEKFTGKTSEESDSVNNQSLLNLFLDQKASLHSRGLVTKRGEHAVQTPDSGCSVPSRHFLDSTTDSAKAGNRDKVVVTLDESSGESSGDDSDGTHSDVEVISLSDSDSSLDLPLSTSARGFHRRLSRDVPQLVNVRGLTVSGRNSKVNFEEWDTQTGHTIDEVLDSLDGEYNLYKGIDNMTSTCSRYIC